MRQHRNRKHWDLAELLASAIQRQLYSSSTKPLEKASGIKINFEDVKSYQETVAKPFIARLKNNSSGYVLSVFSIFDPRKVPRNNSEDLSSYGADSI